LLKSLETFTDIIPYERKLQLQWLFNAVVSIIAISFCIYNSQFEILLWAFIWAYLVVCIGSNAGFHRWASHHSWKPSEFTKWLMMSIFMFGSPGSPLLTVLFHRYHHKHSDSKDDPHSPHIIGWLRGATGQFNKTSGYTGGGRDLFKEPSIIFFHRHYWKVQALIYTTALLLGGPLFLALFVCFAGFYTSTIAGHILDGVTSHYKWLGYRWFDTNDHSNNNPVFALLSGGEAWHNNHHAKPGKYYFGHKWWEFDPAGFLIWAILKRI
jgi:fatty-acid desaturase